MTPALKTIEVNGQKHVVKEYTRPPVVKVEFGKKVTQDVPQPNYRGSGMALCGILKPGQSLKRFRENIN